MNAAVKSVAETFHVTTPSDREIVMTRTFNAPRNLVFEAWTNPKYLAQWMLGPEGWQMPKCEVDLHPGGSWCYGWQHPEKGYFEMSGVYREIAAPERIVHTERMGDLPESLTTIVLTEEDGQTRATLTSVYPSQEIRDMALKSGMTKGVIVSFNRLDSVLSNMA